MRELFETYKKQIIIGFIILLGIIALVLIIMPKKYIAKGEAYINEDLSDREDLPEEEKEESNIMEIGNALYKEATTIYSMTPYCGIEYENIDKNSIITENGTKYYRSNFTNINDINNKILEVMDTNNISITDTIEKNGLIYCKYVEPKKSNTYLGNTYLTITRVTDNQIDFIATSDYLAPFHGELCSLDDIFECNDSDKTQENNNFSIVNKNGRWRVKEFHLYH